MEVRNIPHIQLAARTLSIVVTAFAVLACVDAICVPRVFDMLRTYLQKRLIMDVLPTPPLPTTTTLISLCTPGWYVQSTAGQQASQTCCTAICCTGMHAADLKVLHGFCSLFSSD